MWFHYDFEEEEKKEYDKDVVRISLDEYRDLISGREKLRYMGMMAQECYRDERSKKENAQSELEILRDKVQKYEDWLATDAGLAEKFIEWGRENANVD